MHKLALRRRVCALQRAAFVFTLALLSVPPFAIAQSEEKVGVRPYEMDWAGRTEETRPALVDFEALDGWTVETTNAIASFERSREEQMYGDYVGKLTYRKGDENGAPRVEIRPPEPIAFPADSDAYSCWVVGNNWGWTTDPSTPQVALSVLIKDSEGKELALPLATVNWKEWFLCYRIITEGTRKYLGDSPVFTGFRVDGGANTEDRTLFFDSLCFFKEERAPLETSKRPKPGIDLFEGQDLGVNTGEGRLPFPTTPDTILPDSSSQIRTPMYHFYGDSCDFVYTGDDGELVYKYKPSTGSWTDFSATWGACDAFLPLDAGGVRQLVGEDGALEPVEGAELVKFESTEDGAVAVWKLTSKTATAEVEYRMQIKGKSLIVDTIARGGRVPEVVFGQIMNVDEAKTFSIPYYLYDYSQRPGVASFSVSNSKRPSNVERLFASGHIDWYRSSASYLRGKHGVEAYNQPTLASATLGSFLTGGVAVATPGAPGGVKKYRATVNGGAEYRPKTNGERNDVYERFIFTVSPKFEETLPTIPNPTSPYKAVAGSGVWRSHGASSRERDKNYWRDVWRRGMRHLIVTDHEVCWRDGGESFTFRTKPAPKKGGDEGWFDYARFMQDELGFVYGPYNNFTDFAPVNEYWSPDMINRFSDWSLQPAWMRCYAPKPIRAVEYCEKLTPINEEKFHFSCAYCDVHSSVPPWTRTDYDERVPGAGTFMSVYYPYGEIFLLQKKNWDGPTYSEGPHHCFYAGLTDGNYAQDQPYNLFKNPWLVDFDLRKTHDLEVDFGMGNPGMFAPGYRPSTDEEKTTLIDRFIAATLAFGHSGFFAADYGWRTAARSYFMTQQIASRYTQSPVKSILYYDVNLRVWLETSEALQRDVVKNNQLKVEYENGVTVVVNGSDKEIFNLEIDGRRIALSGNSYVAWTADKDILVESYETPIGGRFDYCESPEYIYLDGREEWVERNRACGAGAGVCRIVSENEFEIIPYDGADLGFKIASDDEVVEAVALDYNLNEMGTARVKRSRGYVFIDPIEGAFSYKVTKRQRTDDDPIPINSMRADPGRFVVAPHQTVQLIVDGKVLTWSAPELPQSMTNGVLRNVEGATNYPGWRENPAPFFHIWTTPRAGVHFDYLLVPHHVMFQFKQREPRNAFPNTIEGIGNSYRYLNSPNGQWNDRIVSHNFPALEQEEGEEEQTLDIKTIVDRFGKYDRVETVRYVFKSDVVKEYERREVFPYPMTDARSYTAYTQRFDQAPTSDLGGTGATATQLKATCGGVAKDAIRIHPPYQNGPTGRTYLEYEPFIMTWKPENFKLWVGKQDGSDLGDGLIFKVEAIEQTQTAEGIKDVKTVVAETLVTDHEWKELVADMSPFRGKRIKLRVIAEANENPNGDWACVADMRLESQECQIVRKLKDVRRVEQGIKMVDAE